MACSRDRVTGGVLLACAGLLLGSFLWFGVACRLFVEPVVLPLCHPYLEWESEWYAWLAPLACVSVTFVFVLVNWMSLKFYRTN